MHVRQNFPQVRAPAPKQIAAAVIGNALEWYDFVVYGFFASVLAQAFFPSRDETASLLLALATFGAGFCTRPLGGLFFGFYADRKGRKAALQLIMFVMTVAIAVIAFAPTYATIGLFAPMLIVIGRLLQGFATGGEFASSTAFLIEVAPAGRRGVYGSLQMVGQGLSILLGTLAGMLVAGVFSAEALHDWAWRLPFFAGLLIGPVGLYVRRHLDETPAFKASPQEEGAARAFLDLVRRRGDRLLACFAATIGATISFYVILVYMPTYGKTEMGLSLAQSFIAQAPGLVLLIVLTPLIGALSDAIGRRPLLLASYGMLLLCVYPLFIWLQAERTLLALTVAQTAFCAILSGLFGALSTALAEQFPTHVRTVGLAIAYNVAVMIFGGFAPFIVAWLIDYLATPIAPAFYLMFGAVVGLMGVAGLHERRHEWLD
ncbi:MFS transporter [Methylocystis rosea]|uniref:MFS transporter n=1 Tax=Methylocystis rosea TaxID=173366 RepID=A0A3G8M285_9HYPH|nr:MFS transporter [Methylocystis rosea]AZG76056.1 MFS transporter [Methylocystis rosea]